MNIPESGPHSTPEPRLSLAAAGLPDLETLLFKAFDHSPLLMTISDLTTGRYLAVNDSFCRVTGFTRAEAIGRTSTELGWISEAERGRMLTQLAQHGRSEALELNLRSKNGQSVVCRYWGEVIETGHGARVFSTAEDITDRRRVEEENRTILRTTIDGFCLVDLDGRILDANDAYCSMIGYTRDELRAIGVSGVEAVETQEVIEQRIQRILKTGSGRFETRHIRKDGRVIDIEATVNLLRGPARLFIFMRDITARKQAEQKLSKSERQLRQSQQVAHLGSWDLDLLALTLDWSDETFALFDKSPATFVPSFGEFVRLVHPEDRETMQTAFDRALASDDAPYQAVVRINNDSGRHWVIESRGVVSRDGDGTPLRIHGTAQDITERRQAEERLLQVMAAVESSSNAIGMSDLQSRHFYQNKAYTELFGYATPAELQAVGGGAATVCDPVVGKELFDTILAGKTWSGELKLVTKGGRVFDAFERADAIKDHAGKMIGLIGVVTDITERKEAEAQLRESQERLALAMDQAHLAYWEMDAATNTFTFNDRFYALYGTTAEREGGYRMPADVYAREFLPSQDRHVVPDDVATLLSGGVDEFQQEHRIRRRDGELRDIVVRITVLRDRTGRVVGTRGANQDITDRKRAEVEREQFFTLFSIASDLMVIADPNGCFKQVNPTLVRLLGYTEDELLGRPFIEFVHPDDVQPTLDEMARQMQTGTSMAFENRYICKDGSVRWLSWRANYIAREHTTYATARDITEHRRAGLALRESEERFRSVFELSADLICIADIKGRFLEVNPTFSTLLGYSRDELVSRPHIDFVHPDDRDKTLQVIAEKLELGETVLHFENRYLRKDGGVAWLEWTSQPLVGKGVTFAIARDITERKQTETALQEAQARLLQAMDQAHLAYWEMDAAAGTFTLNDQFYALYGTTAEHEGGYHMPMDVFAREFLPSEDPSAFMGEVASALRTP
jgi:PAS domain S-box-containing protein